MTNNMYRVGDYVYFETSSGSPYQIRRIEELIKTPAGNVEAKVMCFYRRRDVPSHILAGANLKHHSALDDDADADDSVVPNHHLVPPHLQQSPHSRLLVGHGVPHGSNTRNVNSSRKSHSPLANSAAVAAAAAAAAENDRLRATSSSPPHLTATSTTTTTAAAAVTTVTASVTATSGDDRLGNNNSSCNPSSVSSSAAPTATASANSTTNTDALGGTDERSLLTEDQRHQLRHRELFLSRQFETLPATHIRGKCSVTLLDETETLESYMAKDDTFFYSLVYDPQAKTLIADKGEIRIGTKYQAEVTDLLKEGESDGRILSELEELVWTPQHGLTDGQIDQFLMVARSVGTFARALDCSSSVKQPSLHMSAAAASRDVTLFEAMSLLHKQQYDLSRALSCLVPSTGPLLCRDQMEEWAASEANLFQEALEKYGKDFNDIRQDFLPWKTLKNIIEYYYMWKTTDRYVQQKRVKAAEAESKLKQVYIPNYNKPNPAAISNGSSNGKTSGLVNGNASSGTQGVTCEGCSVTNSNQWYCWGPTQKQSRLCADCWGYWKKLGGLKKASRCAKEEEEAGMRPVVKTRSAFYMRASPALRVMRRLACQAVRRRKAARNPTTPINEAQVRQESLCRLEGRSLDSLTPWLKQLASGTKGAGSGSLRDVALKLGQLDTYCPPWLVVAAKKRTVPPVSSHSYGAASIISCPTTTLTSSSSSSSSNHHHHSQYQKQMLHHHQMHQGYPVTKPMVASTLDGQYAGVTGTGVEAALHSPHQQLLKRRPHQETNGTEGGAPFKRPRESPDPPLDPYRLSQLGVNPPPGLTVTPIGMNGGTNTPPPPPPPLTSSLPSHGVTGTTVRLASNTTATATPPPPPYHSTHHNTSSSPSNMSGSINSNNNMASVTIVSSPSVTGTRNLSQLQHAGGGRTKMAIMSRLSGRPRTISWMDSPDDVAFFYSTAAIKSQRRALTVLELKRAARRPWRRLLSIPPQHGVAAGARSSSSVVAAPAVVGSVTVASLAPSTPMSSTHLTAAD